MFLVGSECSKDGLSSQDIRNPLAGPIKPGCDPTSRHRIEKWPGTTLVIWLTTYGHGYTSTYLLAAEDVCILRSSLHVVVQHAHCPWQFTYFTIPPPPPPPRKIGLILTNSLYNSFSLVKTTEWNRITVWPVQNFECSVKLCVRNHVLTPYTCNSCPGVQLPVYLSYFFSFEANNL